MVLMRPVMVLFGGAETAKARGTDDDGEDDGESSIALLSFAR